MTQKIRRHQIIYQHKLELPQLPPTDVLGTVRGARHLAYSSTCTALTELLQIIMAGTQRAGDFSVLLLPVLLAL
ncbi:hypothetical protein BaRGS_00035887, partial [Batillaria attramentaria]